MRYILSLFKYLHEGGKIDVLKSRPLCGALFQHLGDDPAELINELLPTVEQSLLKDTELPRSSKASILTSQNLEKVTMIASSDHAASERAFAWLKSACQTPEYGILRPSGWYPPGTTKAEQHSRDRSIDLGLDSLDFYDRGETISIRNTTLLSWTLTLRAHSIERERELLLLSFKAAPELVAAYFSEKGMQLDPKLSNTWIGYASLLFEVVAQDLPPRFGNDEVVSLPPQTSIMIENILPRPFDQKVLTRCLNQSSELITFFALRILVVALHKLRAVLKQLMDTKTSGTAALWEEAKERLLQRFLDRAPAIKDVINTFRKIPDDADHALQREAATRVLRLYFEIVPLQAMGEQFDVSVALTSALSRSESEQDTDEIQQLRMLELEHLLAVAKYSSGMKWFAKQGGLAYSPIVNLLRIARRDQQNKTLRSLMGQVLTEHGILNSSKESETRSPTDALVASTVRLPNDSNVWEFVDDCIARASRQPIKYVDNIESLKSQSKDAVANPPSVLAGVVLEQAPFVASQPHDQKEARVTWVDLFLGLLSQTSDASKALQRLIKAVSKVTGWKPPKQQHDPTALFQEVDQGPEDHQETQELDQQVPEQAVVVEDSPWSFTEPPSESTSHPELTRWSQKDVDTAIEDGDVDALILCLCSRHGDIRKQGLAALKRLTTQLRAAQHENAAQISLLIGELTETFEQRYLGNDSSLPYIAGALAVRALHVQTQPHHYMYPKVNRFLIRGPEWRVSRLPSYWLSNTVLGLPEEDDAYWREVQWILDWLVDGLRSPQDLEILRRGDVFEKVMGLWVSPGAERHHLVRERILELIFRACHVEGGSDTLITRGGILSWLGMVSKTGTAVPVSLRETIMEKTDRVQAWAGRPSL